MGYLRDIYEYVKSGETDSRNLGLEIEHFVINEEGNQIPFDEISPLIEEVGKEIGAKIHYTDGFPAGYHNGRYTISLEPACQFEISINPYPDVARIEKIYGEFLELWEPVFHERGYRLVRKGTLPLVESGSISPDDIPLSPKNRYRYMDEYFKKSGKYGKYMMRASASTQVSVDYRSERDLIRKLQLLQKLSPILMIMMESKSFEKSTIPGGENKPHLLRIQQWEDLDPDRTGFFPGSLEAGFGYETIADAIYRTPLILLTDQGTTTPVGSKSAKDLVIEGIIPENEMDEARKIGLIEHFLSMGFFHLRIKKYIEIRIADSVPIKKALGYVALIKGIVYSDRTMELLENELSRVEDLQIIEEAVQQVEKEGLEAVLYNKRTAREWIAYLVDLTGESLPETEKEYLTYV